MATRRTAPRCLTTLLATALAVLATTASPPSSVAAADGVALSSVTTYTVDASTGGVHVTTRYVASNNDAASRGSYYYTGYTVPVPAGAVDFTNTCRGTTPRPIPDNDFYAALDIGISPLHFGTQRVCDVSYNLVGEPRSTNSARINAAYSGFLAWGYGDPGAVTVNVVVPNTFTVEPFYEDWDVTDDGTNTTYTIVVDDPESFSEVVSARNDDKLVGSEVSIESGDFLILSWPGDSEWNAFVEQQVQDGVPVLEELIGDKWPVVGRLEISESFTPYRYGYAGWFSVTETEMEIGDELDQEVVLHELSHAWFNGEVFLERWLSEGFAQVYSNLATEELGGEPVLPDTPTESDPGFSTLTEWSNPGFSTKGTDDSESYGYNASYYVIDQIVDEIGVEKMREVLEIIIGRDVTYPADGEREFSATVTGWKRFLDLVEMVGGSESAEDLLRDFVITTGSVGLLSDREAAREVYYDLEQHGGEWAPPLGIRRSMTNWSFDSALDRIKDAEAVLDLRDELDTLAEAAEADYPDTLEQSYQEATASLDKVSAAVQAQLDSAQVLVDAVEAEGSSHGVFGSIGLIGSDLDATLDDAREAFAEGDLEKADELSQSVIDEVDDSTSTGLIRIGITLGSILLILLIIWLVRRLRRKAKAKAATEADAAAPAPAAAAATATATDEQRSGPRPDLLSAESETNGPPANGSFPPDDDGASGATLTP